MGIQDAIAQLIEGQSLERDQMRDVMNLIMSGGATQAQIGGVLIALRMKGETVPEITAAAEVMRALATKVEVDKHHLVDTCGTGGTGSNKFNISTASAFVSASAGARVAKHGNRAASSNSGSADLLEAAGANILLTPDQVARCINEVGVGFLFAQSHHAAMKHAIGARRELRVRTIFNVLGPLTNPAGATRQVIGVFSESVVEPVAHVLKLLGSEHVMVVHSEDGLDEISTAAPTQVAELKNGEVTTYHLTPEDIGIPVGSLEGLKVNDSAESLALVEAALSGKNDAAADIVALNAGAAIYVSGLTGNLRDGVEMARDAIGAGLAREKMKEFADFTQQISEVD